MSKNTVPPNNYHAKDVYDALTKVGARLSQKAVAALDSHFQDRACIFWGVDDVHTAAATIGRTLSDDDAREVLALVERKHDASVGVTWETLELYAGDFGEPAAPEAAEVAPAG